jgi:hypothetical protein
MIPDQRVREYFEKVFSYNDLTAELARIKHEGPEVDERRRTLRATRDELTNHIADIKRQLTADGYNLNEIDLELGRLLAVRSPRSVGPGDGGT